MAGYASVVYPCGHLPNWGLGFCHPGKRSKFKMRSTVCTEWVSLLHHRKARKLAESNQCKTQIACIPNFPKLFYQLILCQVKTSRQLRSHRKKKNSPVLLPSYPPGSKLHSGTVSSPVSRLLLDVDSQG